MKLKTLSIITVFLFLISIVVYVLDNRRGASSLAGRDYIKGLDVGNISKVEIVPKSGEKLVMIKDGGGFILESHKAYPVATDKINDLIYKIASIQIKEEIDEGVKESELSDFGLGEKSAKFKIVLYDNEGKKSVAFRVGKSKKSRGNYLYREEGMTVHLSSSAVWIGTKYDNYIDKELIKIQKDKLTNFQMKSDRVISFSKKDGKFESRSKKIQKEKIDQYLGGLSYLTFKHFFTPDESKVIGLKFKNKVELKYDNGLIYNLMLAKKQDEYFVKMNASIKEIPKQITVDKNAGKEELMKIDDIVKAQGKAQRFNLRKGRWIYSLEKETYQKIVKNYDFFIK